MKTNRYVIIVSITALLLLIPFIGMQFTDEISWSWLDFVVAAALLMLTGFTLTYISGNIKQKSYNFILSVGVLIILLLVWIEFAVGIF
jgi:high-affinity Fe2+/Pb2+ permease